MPKVSRPYSQCTCTRPIQRYHRRPSTTYRLATIQNVTDRQTDRRQTDRTLYHKRDRTTQYGRLIKSIAKSSSTNIFRWIFTYLYFAYIIETMYRCITSVCEKYYFAEQTNVLFIDVNVCLCLVWGRRQTT